MVVMSWQALVFVLLIRIFVFAVCFTNFNYQTNGYSAQANEFSAMECRKRCLNLSIRIIQLDPNKNRYQFLERNHYIAETFKLQTYTQISSKAQHHLSMQHYSIRRHHQMEWDFIRRQNTDMLENLFDWVPRYICRLLITSETSWNKTNFYVAFFFVVSNSICNSIFFSSDNTGIMSNKLNCEKAVGTNFTSISPDKDFGLLA